VKSKEWMRKIGILTVAIVLLFVVNPELRALVFLIDAVSLEAFLFFIGLQLKGLWPLVQPAIVKLFATLARASAAAFRHLGVAVNALNPRVPMALLAQQTLWAARMQLAKIQASQ